jgi:hypothetical protein
VYSMKQAPRAGLRCLPRLSTGMDAGPWTIAPPSPPAVPT